MIDRDRSNYLIILGMYFSLLADYTHSFQEKIAALIKSW